MASQAKLTGPITPHFPICFNSPANPEDVIGVLLVSVDLTRFSLLSSSHAIMMHNYCLYISARTGYIYQSSNTTTRLDTDLTCYNIKLKYEVWSVGREAEICSHEVPTNFTQLLKIISVRFVMFCFVLSFLFLKHSCGGGEGKELNRCNSQLIHSWVNSVYISL